MWEMVLLCFKIWYRETPAHGELFIYILIGSLPGHPTTHHQATTTVSYQLDFLLSRVVLLAQSELVERQGSQTKTKSGRNGYKKTRKNAVLGPDIVSKWNDKRRYWILHLGSSIGSICRLTVLYRSLRNPCFLVPNLLMPDEPLPLKRKKEYGRHKEMDDEPQEL